MSETESVEFEVGMEVRHRVSHEVGIVTRLQSGISDPKTVEVSADFETVYWVPKCTLEPCP